MLVNTSQQMRSLLKSFEVQPECRGLSNFFLIPVHWDRIPGKAMPQSVLSESLSGKKFSIDPPVPARNFFFRIRLKWRALHAGEQKLLSDNQLFYRIIIRSSATLLTPVFAVDRENVRSFTFRIRLFPASFSPGNSWLDRQKTGTRSRPDHSPGRLFLSCSVAPAALQ